MTAVSFLKQRATNLARAQAPANLVDFARLEGFILVRMGAAISIFLLFVACLALGPSLVGWHCAAYCCLMSPLVAIFALSRGASLMIAEIISASGFIALAIVLFFAGPSLSLLAYGILLLAALEGAVASNRFTAQIVIGIVASAFGCIALLTFNGLSIALIEWTTAAALYAIILYGGGLCWASSRVNALAHFKERRETLRHETLAQTIGDLVLRLDKSGSVTHASAEALPLFNVSPRDLVDRGFFERLHVADRPAFLNAVLDAIEDNRTIACVGRIRRGQTNDTVSEWDESGYAWIEMRLRKLPQERRKTDMRDNADLISIVRDVTRTKIAEEEIETARVIAEKANLSKDRFLANISHELRTPLNAIIGFSEILGNADLAPKDPARIREYAEIIHSSGQHLLEVVNSILDISKIDAGSFEILPEAFSLPPLIDQCCDMMQLKASVGKVNIIRDYPAQLEELIADKRACKQVLINLLSNAVKFTPAGGAITISAQPEGNIFVISVSDTGIGISASDMQNIGSPFFQAHNSNERSYEGTGLGLSLVQGLVGLHNGAISVESAPGEGTAVTIRLPMDCSARNARSCSAPIEKIVRIGSKQHSFSASAISSTNAKSSAISSANSKSSVRKESVKKIA